MLATHLVTLKIIKQEGGGSETRGGGYFIATGSGYGTGVYGYTVPVIYGTYETAPTIETVDGEAERRRPRSRPLTARRRSRAASTRPAARRSSTR
jgi:hypothetical protein